MKRITFIKNFTVTNGMLILSPTLIFKDLFFELSKGVRKIIKIKKLTCGPEKHWFGYYDKLQTDPTGRYILSMQVSFEGRTPTPNDEIKIGFIDANNKNQWKQLGKSLSWGWQQGCMLQWLPNSKSEILWNDRDGDQFVSYILNIFTGEKRKLSKPIYTVSPDGKWALGLDFARLQDLRPGYGYVGLKDPFYNQCAPDQTGIYRIDLATGEDTLIIPYSQCAKIPHLGQDVDRFWHWYNHLLIAPDSNSFVFLNRWRETREIKDQGTGFTTRMITANKSGKDTYIIDPSGETSHFIWRDDKHITAWTKPEEHSAGFYVIEDRTGKFISVGKESMTRNGHITYVPGTNNEWILNDTYPQGKERFQELYLFHLPSNNKVVLGTFHSPPEYKGEWRCDLHPKCTSDGKKIIFDSTHEGDGRQIYMIDIENIISK